MLPYTALFLALKSALVNEKPFLKVRSMFYPKSWDSSWPLLKSSILVIVSFSPSFMTSGKIPNERICPPQA